MQREEGLDWEAARIAQPRAEAAMAAEGWEAHCWKETLVAPSPTEARLRTTTTEDEEKSSMTPRPHCLRRGGDDIIYGVRRGRVAMDWDRRGSATPDLQTSLKGLVGRDALFKSNGQDRMKVGQNKMLMVLFEAGTELGGAGFVLRSSDAVVQLIGGKLLQVAVGLDP
ncbi:hypothetical protein C4D60_Mb08t15460 [Musa balbisiana]|uniref:Uncharacterized protein n=1 Tax=Musa balbisiana TaxID=52838 RepID=A0A4S8K441_MUSBA|nr:hypothetical protein C4D60_Mb08t15460 [Musa balbisiana]